MMRTPFADATDAADTCGVVGAEKHETPKCWAARLFPCILLQLPLSLEADAAANSWRVARAIWLEEAVAAHRTDLLPSPQRQWACCLTLLNAALAVALCALRVMGHRLSLPLVLWTMALSASTLLLSAWSAVVLASLRRFVYDTAVCRSEMRPFVESVRAHRALCRVLPSAVPALLKSVDPVITAGVRCLPTSYRAREIDEVIDVVRQLERRIDSLFRAPAPPCRFALRPAQRLVSITAAAVTSSKDALSFFRPQQVALARKAMDRQTQTSRRLLFTVDSFLIAVAASGAALSKDQPLPVSTAAVESVSDALAALNAVASTVIAGRRDDPSLASQSGSARRESPPDRPPAAVHPARNPEELAFAVSDGETDSSTQARWKAGEAPVTAVFETDDDGGEGTETLSGAGPSTFPAVDLSALDVRQFPEQEVILAAVRRRKTVRANACDIVEDMVPESAALSGAAASPVPDVATRFVSELKLALKTITSSHGRRTASQQGLSF